VPSPERGGASALDVLIVSLGSTGGLRVADAQLAESMRRAGASVSVAAPASPSRRLRTLALVDLAWARAVRRAAVLELARLRPRAVIYSSTTAALLWPRVGAIRFDATSAGNRPGRHGLWQRPVERLRLGEASLLLPWSDAAMLEAPVSARRGDRVLVLPVAVESSAPGPSAVRSASGPGARDIAAVTYAANPSKKGLDRVLAAWRRVRVDPEELVIAGVSAQELRRSGFLRAGEPGVRVVGPLETRDYRALLRRARVFVCAPRREDYGIAQLEALADGCLLVSTPAAGPYAALPIARALDPRLVADDLAVALRCALDDPAAGYAEHALEALLPFGREAVDRLVADELLPRLLA